MEKKVNKKSLFDEFLTKLVTVIHQEEGAVPQAVTGIMEEITDNFIKVRSFKSSFLIAIKSIIKIRTTREEHE